MDAENSKTESGKSENQYADLKKELIEIATILEKYPEPLRPKVFDVLLGAYCGKLPSAPPTAFTPTRSEEPSPSEPATHAPENGDGNKPKRRSIPDTYSIDPDLNLHGGGNVKSFEKFVAEKKPSSNAEFNTVAVYYITKILNQPRATLKQAWTCYKDVKRRTPDYFKQSFTDTKNKTGYIKITDEFELEISGRGENFVEHDLPPKEAPKAQ
jgi:hypothetical protein